MPYFSFSLKQNFLNKNDISFDGSDISIETTYFSKNTKLWKNLNKKKNKKHIFFAKFQERVKLTDFQVSILFCLPPSIGFGDSIEYGNAIKNIVLSKKFTLIGIAFTGRFNFFLKEYFNFENVFGEVINENEMMRYSNIFHLSLEIKDLKFQKYVRSDIEYVILKYFKIKKIFPIIKNDQKKKIERIDIFPVSQSPLRSIQPTIINSIINHFGKKYEIRIICDESLISNFIEKNIVTKKNIIVKPKSLNELCELIKETQFGIFPDSGPLHFAKMIGIKGVFIETTVGSEILLRDCESIKEIKNIYSSLYCAAPCGLTNLISFENKVGCYKTLKVTRSEILKKKNLNSFQRGSIKGKYIDFMFSQVECIKGVDIKKLINIIKYNIEIK